MLPLLWSDQHWIRKWTGAVVGVVCAFVRSCVCVFVYRTRLTGVCMRTFEFASCDCVPAIAVAVMLVLVSGLSWSVLWQLKPMRVILSRH